MHFISKIIFIVYAAAHLCCPQTLDSLNLISSAPRFNSLTTKFNKQLSTYNLLTKFDFTQSFGDHEVSVNENFNSTYIRSTVKSIRDEQLFAVKNKFNFSREFSGGLGFSSNIFSDNRKIEINQASTNQVFIFSRIDPNENIFAAPYLGYMNNKQVLKDDKGLLYGIEALVDKFMISDLIISSDLRYRNEEISPRKNTLRHFGLLLTSEFTKEISNNFGASYSQNRKDFYFEADSLTSLQFNVSNNIQSRTESNYLIQNRLIHDKLFESIAMDVSAGIYWRKIERDTRYKRIDNANSSIFDSEINELKLDFESNLIYSSKSFNGILRLIYSERDEKNLAKRIPNVPEILFQERSELESRKNNHSTRGSLSLIGNFHLSKSDIVNFSLLHNKLRYDTPSKENFDDRDELLSIARIRYIKKFTPFFEGFINTEGTYNQIVYIFSQKSSNNNINRIIKLSAGGNYTGRKLSSSNSFEVSANYTVYDFQDLNPNIKSYSFRQFTALDSTSFLFNTRLKFSFFGYIKLSEQGDLRWNEFKSRPTRYLQEILIDPKVTVDYRVIIFSAGMRFFSLSTYGYKSNSKFLESDFRSIGPIAEIFVASSEKLNLRIWGWYEFISASKQPSKEQANLSIDMTWNF
mgnify:FL=1